MFFYNFFFGTAWYGLIAIPHLFTSKFLYEFKWNFIAAAVTIISITGMMVFPPLIIFAYPIQLPVLDTIGEKVVAVFLFVIWNRFPEGVNTASACLAFRERLDMHHAEKRAAMPTAEEQQAKDEAHLQEVENLRSQRMPSRWSGQ